MASGDPLLMAERYMIIIAYFFLLRPREYRGPKSDIPPFHLEDTAFIFSRSVFVTTSTASDLKATNFVTLTFTTQENRVREKNRKQGVRRPSFFPQGGPPPAGDPPDIPQGSPPALH